MSNEKWKPVLGYEDTYEVSSLGNVRRKAGSDHCPIARPRKLVPRGKYFQVILSKNGKVALKWVHRLIAESFFGPPTNAAYYVNHKDGNGQNNNVRNLEWISHAGNMKHAYDTGLRVAAPSVGSANPNSKFTEESVIAVRCRHASGERISAIARDLGVTKGAVWQVVHRRSWQHVP